MSNVPNLTELEQKNSNDPETVEADPDREVLVDLGVKPDGLGCLAKYISSTLGSVINDFDSKAESTTRSQVVLGHSLDHLTSGNFFYEKLGFEIKDRYLGLIGILGFAICKNIPISYRNGMIIY